MKPASQSPPPGPRARPQHPDCGRRALCQCPCAPGLASTLPDLKLPVGRATTGPKQEAPQRWPAPTRSVQGPRSPPIRPPAPPPQPKLARTSVRWGSLWPPAPRRAVRQCGRGQPVLPSAEPMAPSLSGKGPGLWSLSPGCGSGGGHGRRWGRVGAGAALGPGGSPAPGSPGSIFGGLSQGLGTPCSEPLCSQPPGERPGAAAVCPAPGGHGRPRPLRAPARRARPPPTVPPGDRLTRALLGQGHLPRTAPGAWACWPDTDGRGPADWRAAGPGFARCRRKGRHWWGKEGHARGHTVTLCGARPQGGGRPGPPALPRTLPCWAPPRTSPLASGRRTRGVSKPGLMPGQRESGGP